MKNLLVQLKIFFIVLADLAAAFLALLSMILLRYGRGDLGAELGSHVIPFAIITFLFLLIFYIFNLYSFRFNKSITEFTESFVKSIIVSFAASILVFYVFGGFFELTPKTNLFIFTLIFGVIDFYFRILLRRYFGRQNISRRIIIIDGEKDSLSRELSENHNAGYEVIRELDSFNLEEIISLHPDVVIMGENTKADFDKIYALVKRGIFVYTIKNFYEETFQKIPAERMAKEEIVDYISANRAIFNLIKRVLDIALSLVLLVLFSPIFLLIATLVKATSKGAVLFKHKRISLNDTEFTIYKFRSMHTDAEKNGAMWTKDNKTDPRITSIGRFLRNTHLDELPQLLNILKGDISFVGPRPERPEFINKLKEQILYYDLRHAVKAGLTGWAQVNYRYGASTEDAKEKLRYDFFYIKNRSIFFDILIILKTLAKIFTR